MYIANDSVFMLVNMGEDYYNVYNFNPIRLKFENINKECSEAFKAELSDNNMYYGCVKLEDFDIDEIKGKLIGLGKAYPDSVHDNTIQHSNVCCAEMFKTINIIAKRSFCSDLNNTKNTPDKNLFEAHDYLITISNKNQSSPELVFSVVNSITKNQKLNGIEDRKLITLMLEYSLYINAVNINIPETKFNNRKFLYDLIKMNPDFYQQINETKIGLNEKFIDDVLDFYKEKGVHNGFFDRMVIALPDEYKNKQENAQKIVSIKNDCFKYLNEELRNNKEFCLEILNKGHASDNCFQNYLFVSDRLQADLDIVEIALANEYLKYHNNTPSNKINNKKWLLNESMVFASSPKDVQEILETTLNKHQKISEPTFKKNNNLQPDELVKQYRTDIENLKNEMNDLFTPKKDVKNKGLKI